VASSKLSALQLDLVEAFFAEPSAFFLTGGAALAGYYLGHRITEDLDLFSPPTESMQLAAQRLRRAAHTVGATVEAMQEAPDFHRYAVQRAEELTLVDLVIDRAPQLIAEKELHGKIRIDSEREITANKITALLGRTAPRDLVDLFALLDRGHSLDAALSDARTKDGAADPATLAWALSQWRLGPTVPLPLGVTLDDIERMRTRLIERLLVLAVPRDL
jgi:predicted nucleotidyltransferase component of viral defense system